MASESSERVKMKINESGNIEIESEEDYKKGVINDNGFTYNPQQDLYTKDLRHCVGLALIEEVNGVRKRGLMHIHYNKEFSRNGKNNIIIPKEKAKKTSKILRDFIRDFMKDERRKKVFKNPKAIIVYLRTIAIGKTIEKIVLKDELSGEFKEKEIEDTNRYENPMADYIKNWLEIRNIGLYASNATSNKKLPGILNMEDDPKEIHYKEFSLGHDRIRIGMYNKKGILLNKKDYEAWLDF